jgi:hypothetical protein
MIIYKFYLHSYYLEFTKIFLNSILVSKQHFPKIFIISVYI